jgi:homocysteine S-methyltransferase
LTDGGFETWLFFQQGFVAPEFAATVLMEDDDARSAMRKYFDQLLQMATSADIGFILDTNTWRGCTKWAPKLDKTEQEMIEISKNAVEFVKEIRNAWKSKNTPVILNGVIRPSGDGYQPEILSSVVAARDLHRLRIGALVESGVDLISAITMTNIDGQPGSP